MIENKSKSSSCLWEANIVNKAEIELNHYHSLRQREKRKQFLLLEW